jgi:hypothetical protein
MAHPTLQQFLERPSPLTISSWHDQAWVREKGFKSLYVRKNIHWLEHQLLNMLTISSVHARDPGAGAFTALL